MFPAPPPGRLPADAAAGFDALSPSAQVSLLRLHTHGAACGYVLINQTR